MVAFLLSIIITTKLYAYNSTQNVYYDFISLASLYIKCDYISYCTDLACILEYAFPFVVSEKCYWKCALNCLNLECILSYPRYKIRMQIHLRLLHYGSFLNFELPPSKITSFLLLILRFANSIHVSVNNLFSVWNPWELILIWTNSGEY